VDRIDLKMLQLLQQRTKLSGQIGKVKRRHGAVIYVPERERDLLARLVRLSKGRLPAKVVVGLYREILSSSRAEQQQPPIGFLAVSADRVLPAGHAAFGVCDQFLPTKTWSALAKRLRSGAFSLGLLTGDDLARALKTSKQRREFADHLTVAGDFSPTFDAKASLARRIFIITPRRKGAPRWPGRTADQFLILIECKSTANAIKSLLRSMPDFSFHAEVPPHRTGPGRSGLALARLSLARAADATKAASQLLSASKAGGIPLSILGDYLRTEDYGG
jgi:chorismate mutase